MASLSVQFEVPEFIQKGLESGLLERLGGVVRERDSGQIVMWLREGTQMQPDSSVSQFVQSTSSSLSKVKPTQVVAGANLALLVVNVAMNGAILSKLEQLSQKVDKIYEYLKRRDDRAFYTRIGYALKALQPDSSRDYDETTSATIKQGASYFLDDSFKEALKQPKLELAYDRLQIAAQAFIVVARYHAKFHGIQDGINELKEPIERVKDASDQLIKAYLDKQAAYFYKDTDDELLEAFLNFQLRWRESDEAQMLRNVIKEVRSDFWDDTAIAIYRKSSFDELQILLNRKQPVDPKNKLRENLVRAELVFENYQRLLGAEIELRAERLTLSDREQLLRLERDEELERKGGFIVDMEYLQRAS